MLRGIDAPMTLPTAPLHLPDELPDGPRLRDRWPLGWADGALLLGIAVVLWGVYVGIGHLITGPLKGTALERADHRAVAWFVPRRTPTCNDLATIGSTIGDTTTKVVGTLIICLLLLWVLKRWYEVLLVAVALIFEATVFLCVTLVVKRPRPDVPRLQGSPIDSSFPSGHTAATMTYLAIAVVLSWHVARRWARIALIVAAVLLTFYVAFSRMYEGMHFPTDVTFGALLGLISVLVVDWVLRRAVAKREHGRAAPPVEPTTTVM